MKIIKLTASNIKKLVAVEITPTTNIVKITGRNAAGKSAVLDSIFWALSGEANIQERPIREGENRAVVELDLGDMIVTRSWSQTKDDQPITTALAIENKNRTERFKSPQTLLNTLLGQLSFDPLEFMRQTPTEQIKILRQLTGVDFSQLDNDRQRLYNERTLLNRETNKLRAQHDAMNVPACDIVAEIDTQGIVDEISRVVGLRERRVMAEKVVNDLDNKLYRDEDIQLQIVKQICVYQDKIAELQNQLQAHKRGMEELKASLMEAHNIVQAMVIPDITDLQTQLSESQTKNKNFHSAQVAKKQKDSLFKQYNESQKESDFLTTKIEHIDAKKEEIIQSATFPLEGLGFGNGEVTYKNLPLVQASSAEQLRISIGMAMKMNPKLKILRITDGSLLDSESMKVIEEMCRDADFQCWLECVDESGKVGIYIEDGKVVAVND